MTDPDAAAAALGLGPLATSERITTGHDAETWRLDTADGAVLALRVLRPGRDPSRELAALHAAAKRGLPVPHVRATGTLGDRAAIVTTWCAGRTMADLVQAGDDPRPLGRLLGATQRELHRPAADGTVLCHLDFHPFNVLTAAGRVTGIVDWANARRADPRDDLATTQVVLAFAETQLEAPDGAVSALATAWRAGYGDFPSHAELRPFLVAAAELNLSTWRDRVEAGLASESKLHDARRVAESV